MNRSSAIKDYYISMLIKYTGEKGHMNNRKKYVTPVLNL